MVDKDNPKLRKNGGEGTFVGKAFKGIKEVAPDVLNLLGTITGVESLNKLGDSIRTTSSLTEEDKSILLAEIQKDIAVEQEITKREAEISKRWESDSHSDSKLSKNIRPLALTFLLTSTVIILILDASIGGFIVQEYWVTLLGSMTVTALGGYFALREIGKFVDKKYKK